MTDASHSPRRHFDYSNVMSTLAVFLVIAGGSALAAALPKNSVKSKTVKDNSLKSKDLKDGKAVKGSDVVDDSLTGANVNESTLSLAPDSVGTAQVADETLRSEDINDNSLGGGDIVESTLGQVPSALLGGFGRSAGDADNSCDPESTTLIVCTSVDLNLPAQTRVLLIGQIGAREEVTADSGFGTCELGTSTVDLPSTSASIDVGAESVAQTDNTTMVGITPVLGPGTEQFRIRCNQLASGAIVYGDSEIAAVALSAG